MKNFEFIHLTSDNLEEILSPLKEKNQTLYYKMKIKYSRIFKTEDTKILCALYNKKVIGQISYNYSTEDKIIKNTSQHNRINCTKILTNSKFKETPLLQQMIKQLEIKALFENKTELNFSLDTNSPEILNDLLESGMFIYKTKEDKFNNKTCLLLKKKLDDALFNKALKRNNLETRAIAINNFDDITLSKINESINQGFVGIKIDKEKNLLIFKRIYMPNNERSIDYLPTQTDSKVIEEETKKKKAAKLLQLLKVRPREY